MKTLPFYHVAVSGEGTPVVFEAFFAQAPTIVTLQQGIEDYIESLTRDDGDDRRDPDADVYSDPEEFRKLLAVVGQRPVEAGGVSDIYVAGVLVGGVEIRMLEMLA